MPCFDFWRRQRSDLWATAAFACSIRAATRGDSRYKRHFTSATSRGAGRERRHRHDQQSSQVIQTVLAAQLVSKSSILDGQAAEAKSTLNGSHNAA